MTLIAAFRASKGGILLCSDRHEEDSVSKRSVDKIYRINNLKSCQVFMTGSGPITPVKNTFAEIHKSLQAGEDSGIDVAWEHRELIETSLKSIYQRYEVLQTWPMNLIIVVAPRQTQRNISMFYSTDATMLSPEERYVTHGSGKGVADYLSSRLYSDDLVEKWLVITAAFIFREAGESSVGVGFGSDMIMINNGRQDRWEIPHTSVGEIEHTLPLTDECLRNCWAEIESTTGFPHWLNR